MGNCAICGKYSCACCATLESWPKHPPACGCWRCFKNRTETAFTPKPEPKPEHCPECDGTGWFSPIARKVTSGHDGWACHLCKPGVAVSEHLPKANPEPTTATGRIAGRDAAGKVKVFVAAHSDHGGQVQRAAASIRKVTALVAPDKMRDELDDLYENGEFSTRSPSRVNPKPAPRELFNEWQKGCGNTTTGNLPPWACDECTKAMVGAIGKAFEHEDKAHRHDQIKALYDFKNSMHGKGVELEKEIKRLRQALEYIVATAARTGGAGHVASQVLHHGATEYTETKAREDMNQ